MFSCCCLSHPMIDRRQGRRPPFGPRGDGSFYCGLVFFVASFFIPIVSQNVMAAFVQSVTYYKNHTEYNFTELVFAGDEQHVLDPTFVTRIGACQAYDAIRNIVDIRMVYHRQNYDAWGGVLLNDCELACKLMVNLGFLGYTRPRDSDATKDFDYSDHLPHASGMSVVSYGCKSLQLKTAERFAHVTGLASGLVDKTAKLFRELGVRRTVVVHNMVQAAERLKKALKGEGIVDVHLLNIGYVPRNNLQTGQFEDENYQKAANFILYNARCKTTQDTQLKSTITTTTINGVTRIF